MDVLIEILLTQKEINVLSDILDRFEEEFGTYADQSIESELRQMFTELWQVEIED